MEAHALGRTIFLIRNYWAVRIRPAVAEELPGVSHLANFVHVQVGDDEFVLVARGFSDYLTSRIAKITLSVKFSDVPRRFGPDAVYRPNEIAVRDSVSRLFEFP